MNGLGNPILALFPLLLAVGILTLMVLEIQAYYRGRTLIERSQLWWRLMEGSLFLALLALLSWGLLWRFPSRLSEVLFWSGCILLAGVIAVLALLDLRRVLRQRLQKESELFRDFSDEVLRPLIRKREEGAGCETREAKQGEKDEG